MPIKRDKRTKNWFFRTMVTLPDKTKTRISGTPGVAGPFRDLVNSKVGALEAERRAVAQAMTGHDVRRATATTEEVAISKTIREHAVTFLELYKQDSKPSTKRGRRHNLEGHLLPYFGDLVPEDLKQTDVDAFTAGEFKRGIASKTINNVLGTLSSLVQYATGEKSKLRFHVSGMLGEIHAVSSEDVERLLEACTDDRYRALILLASEAGLRCGEIRGLQWTDIKDGQLTVRRALDFSTVEVIPPKHNKARAVPLSPRLTEALADLPRRGLWVVGKLDGGPLGYFAVIEAVGAIYDRSKVTRPDKPIHCLRHTFGTVMARRVPLGVLQKLMGHAEVTTTMRYVDVSEDDKRDAIAEVFGRGSHVAADSKKARK